MSSIIDQSNFPNDFWVELCKAIIYTFFFIIDSQGLGNRGHKSKLPIQEIHLIK